MRPRALLVLLVGVWAVSWPVIKIGVGAVPPIWFGCLRYAIATVILAAIAGVQGRLHRPSRADRRLILVSGVLQMAAYSALTGLALTKLPAGRASVLGFSTPLWVVPLAMWRGQERPTRAALLGVGAGLGGIVVIALPTILRGGAPQAAPYLMLAAAALAWAVSIVFVQEHRFDADPLALAPWQTLVASVLLLVVAMAREGSPPSVVGVRALAALAYVGPVATAFAYWAMVHIGRRIPASTLSVALLATPSLGLTISALVQRERIDAPLLAGLALVAAGIRLATLQSGR
jgi:drug/metabolite transporter (DMT)-like permease